MTSKEKDFYNSKKYRLEESIYKDKLNNVICCFYKLANDSIKFTLKTSLTITKKQAL